MRSFIKPLAWLPVIIINAIIAWSYFAYMVIFGFGKSALFLALSFYALIPSSVDLQFSSVQFSYIMIIIQIIIKITTTIIIIIMVMIIIIIMIIIMITRIFRQD